MQNFRTYSCRALRALRAIQIYILLRDILYSPRDSVDTYICRISLYLTLDMALQRYKYLAYIVKVQMPNVFVSEFLKTSCRV